jgi:AcrR family transcriptional regulator
MARNQKAVARLAHWARSEDVASPDALDSLDNLDGRAAAGLRAAVEILTNEGWEAVTPGNVAARAHIERSEIDSIWADRNALVRDAVRSVAIKAAIELLTNDGWDAVTQAKVAERSGLGRATLYRYWPKREDLVRVAVVSHMAIRTHIEPSGEFESDLLDELHNMASEMRDRSLNTVLAAIIDRAEFQEDQRKLKLEIHNSGTAVVRTLLQDAVARGELKSGSDVDASISLLVGPVVYRALVSDEPLDREFTTWLVRTFLDANGASQPTRGRPRKA